MPFHVRHGFAAALWVALCLGLAGPAPAAPSGAAEQVAGLAAADSALAPFYALREGRPLWSVAGGPLAPDALIAALEAAPSHALPAAAYGAEELRAKLAQAAESPDRAAAAEIALSRALARYAGDMAAGALRPSRVDPDIHVFPLRPEPAALLSAAAAAPDLAAWLARLEPREPGYDRLRAIYAQMRTQTAEGGWRVRLGEGGTLRPGDAGPRVTQLRHRLAELGDPAPATDRPEVFDAGLAGALKEFQRRHGLNADGVAGRMTFAALGADAGERLRQAAVNLERMRWRQVPLDERTHILVNLPDYAMRFVEDGTTVHESRAVVGSTARQTQEFSGEMTYLVVNPTWNVPRSIATRDILPILREDPDYLRRKGMRLESTAGVPADPYSHDYTRYSESSFPYRIRQAPGPGNSLGRVKFMFPNQFNIYLHDTPEKHLFARDRRAYSSGCVRVENPFRLAHLLLAPQLADPEGTFQSWLDTGRERYVNLDRPVRVHITYRTVWVDETGRPQFRADVYGRDAKVWAALEAAGLDAGL